MRGTEEEVVVGQGRWRCERYRAGGGGRVSGGGDVRGTEEEVVGSG